LGLFFANVEFRAERKELLDKSAYLYVASSVVMSFWPLHFKDYQKIIVVTLHESLDKIMTVHPEEVDSSLKYKVDVSMSHLTMFFKQPRISEEEIVQLKLFLKGESVSPVSFASIVCPEWIIVLAQLVDFSGGNEFFLELQDEYQKNKKDFTIRYPEFTGKIPS
jgi:hypothetical protein